MGTTTATKLCPVRPAATGTPEPLAQFMASAPTQAQLEQEKLLLRHLPQVRLVAKSIRERLQFSMEMEDLVAYGVMGLLKAIERFDPSRGVLLKTYAEHRIRGAILDGLRGMDWLSRSVRRKEREYQESQRMAEQETLGRVWTPCPAPPAAERKRKGPAAAPQPEVAPRLPRLELIYCGGNLEDLEKMSERAGLRAFLHGSRENPETAYERRETAQRLTQAISRLPQRSRLVIELYYHRELSMKQIGELLHVHESRISQLHATAIERLRLALAAVRQEQPPSARRDGSQGSRRRRSKYRLTASKSSSVSTPMVSSAVSAT